MKKYITLLLSTIITTASFAQNEILIAGPSSGNGRIWDTAKYYNPWNGSTDKITAPDLWLWDESQPENSTISDGKTVYQRGTGGIDQKNQVLYIRHNITGRINYANNDKEQDDSSDTTTIYGLDDPTVSSVTGSTGGHPTSKSAKNQPDSAFSSFGNKDNFVSAGSYRFVEGNYFGGESQNAALIWQAQDIDIEGASFVAGERGEAFENLDSAPSGMHLVSVKNVTISNRTGVASDRFEGGIFRTSKNLLVAEGNLNKGDNLTGGDGLSIFVASSTTIRGGDFFASQHPDGISHSIDHSAFGTKGASVTTRGGRGVALLNAGPVTIEAGNYIGGDGGDIVVGGPDATANSMGGEGAVISGGTGHNITGGNFVAGSSKSSTIVPVGAWIVSNLTQTVASDANGEAIALGASGLRLVGAGIATISGITTIGSAGSVAIANGSNSTAEATGGSGLLAQSTTTTIESGTFTGARGGTAMSQNGNAHAFGGAGAMVLGGSLIVNGGTFTGGAGGVMNGVRQMDGVGIWADGANVTIDDATGNTLINNGVYFANPSVQTLNLFGGKVNGDILIEGAGTTALGLSTNAIINGVVQQQGGTVNVTLSEAEASKIIKHVEIDGKMDFNSDFSSAAGSTFTLENRNSQVEFNSLSLNGGSQIMAGGGKVDVTVGNLVLGDGSSLNFSYDGGWSTNGISPTFGQARIIGGLVMSNTGSRITLSGAAATTTGSVAVVAAGSATDFGANNPNDAIHVDLGWLVKTNNIDTTAGITVDFDYNALTNNTSLADLGITLLSELDAAITDTNYINKGKFLALNSNGKAAGEQLIRYSTTQIPDVADAAFQTQLQVSEVAAARGSEFRSMNGYASSKPNFGRTAPQGAAGPNEDGESDMQGWMRGYGSFSSRDTEGTFADYDSESYGVVVGVDKSFGNLLIGLAGGYGSASIDAGTTYDADVNNYHGTLYSTFGGESTYVDLALTYGISDTKVNNIVADDTFDSHSASAYIGAGKSFNVSEKLKITPEASLLTSHYTQDEYDRAGLIMMSIKEYDEWSYLGSLGLNLASAHQIDWLNMGMAVIPEFRVHWLHEFNPDLDDFTYVSSGSTKTFGVRSREEDLIKVGAGLDMWSWRYQNAKLEVDYDGVFGKDYEQHTFSLKGTLQF